MIQNKSILIKSPLNYIGGKYKILNQILPYFPSNINNFIDLFAGGCNVGINVNANKVFFNDNLTYLVEMYNIFKENSINETIHYIEDCIDKYKLTKENDAGYKKLREVYNTNKYPLDLFVLIAFSFNHQIRFNSKHEFNTPFGKERSSFNISIKNNLILFLTKLKEVNVEFSNLSFEDFKLDFLSEDDFVYCDPPYLITTGSYNDGKRGFKGWTEDEEYLLLTKLNDLDTRGIKFALSNVLKHKGKHNNVLAEWLSKNPQYKVNLILSNYSNSNYHTIIRDKNASSEVLITNYSNI